MAANTDNGKADTIGKKRREEKRREEKRREEKRRGNRCVNQTTCVSSGVKIRKQF